MVEKEAYSSRSICAFVLSQLTPIVSRLYYVTVWFFSSYFHPCFTEKVLVQDFIKAAVTSKDDYYNRDIPVEYVENDTKTKLPPINETNQLTQQQIAGDVDRYATIECQNLIPSNKFRHITIMKTKVNVKSV